MLTTVALRLFLDERRSANCRPRTIEFYERELTRVAELHAELPLDPAPLRAILGRIGGSPSTRRTAYRAWHACYRWLKAERYIEDDPMERVRPPLVPDVDQRTLDRVDVARLLALELSTRDRALLTLLLDTGIRSGELRSLRGRDLHDGWISVEGKRGQRTVPVHQDTLTLLRICADGPHEPVLRTYDGRPLTRNRVYRIVRAALAQLGLDGDGKSGPHCLRHTFGRHWAAVRGPLPSLQRVMGHKSITTTMIYVKLAAAEVDADFGQFSQLTQDAAARVRRVK